MNLEVASRFGGDPAKGIEEPHCRSVRSLAAARVRSELQYRTSFALMLVAQIMASGIELVSLAALFTNTRAIRGWTAPQVLWLFMITSCAFGLADIFTSQVEELPDLIRTGKFDSYLLRPVPVLLAIVADGFELRRIGRLLPGAISFVVMLVRPRWFAVDLTLANLAAMVAAIVIGAVIFASTFIATNAVAFWLVDSRESANALTYGGRTVSQFPLDILGVWFRRFFVWFVPIGFVAWLPGTTLLSAPKPAGVPAGLAHLAPVAAIFAVCGASLVWRQGMRRYESTGS